MTTLNPPPASRLGLWRAAAAALLLLDLAKHAGLIALGQTQPWPDADGYWALATAAANGDWWLMQSAQAARTPAYPWFLAVCQLAAGHSALLLTVILQHSMAMITAMLTGWLTAKMSASRWAGLIAYGMMVGLTARDLYANYLLTESLATLLQIVTVCLLAQQLCVDRRWLFFWTCCVTGVGLLVRPALLVLVPILEIGTWGRRNAPRAGFERAVRVICGTLLLLMIITPWCLRNHRLFGRFTLTAFLGRELWTAQFSPWPGAELPIPEDGAGAQIRERAARSATPVDLRHNWSLSGALTTSGLNDLAADDLMAQAASQAIFRQPGRVLARTGVRCLTFWYTKEWPPPAPVTDQLLFADQKSWTDPRFSRVIEIWLKFSPERHFVAMWIFAGLAWASVVLGMRLPGPARPHFAMLGAVLLLTTLLTAALEIPLYRYRMGLEPLMVASIVSAGTLFVRTRTLIESKKSL